MHDFIFGQMDACFIRGVRVLAFSQFNFRLHYFVVATGLAMQRASRGYLKASVHLFPKVILHLSLNSFSMFMC